MSKDDLGERMKGYEYINRDYLMRRMPTIIRIDGKSFHTFTKGFKKPFDEVLVRTMWETAEYLCKNIMGCKLAYVQSDEISLLLTDYDTITTEGWFGKNIQKIASVSASMATLAFNKYFKKNVTDYNVVSNIPKEYDCQLALIYRDKIDTALFDSRTFNLPKDEVCNYFLWRQNDATKNSIQMLARSKFSHKSLLSKNTNKIQEMLFTEFNINFNDITTSQKRGICIIKKDESWIIDLNIPRFSQDREYINKLVFINE